MLKALKSRPFLMRLRMGFHSDLADQELREAGCGPGGEGEARAAGGVGRLVPAPRALPSAAMRLVPVVTVTVTVLRKEGANAETRSRGRRAAPLQLVPGGTGIVSKSISC